MQIIRSLSEITKPFPNAVITIGNFDGVHIGHQALLKKTVEMARENNGIAIAMTFEPHPQRFLHSEVRIPLITLLEQKTELIDTTGIDILLVLPFTTEIAQMDPTFFITHVLKEKIGVTTIVLGKDASFGKEGSGSLSIVKKITMEVGLSIVELDWVHPKGTPRGRISSTLIRNLVTEGNVTEVVKYLGRCYQVRGIVTRGQNRGESLLGFPTANLDLQDELTPAAGVYAVFVQHKSQIYPGVANIGTCPTFENAATTVEAHLFDFNGNLYGELIRINFADRIRDEFKFDSAELLAQQIQKDVARAKEMVATSTCLKK